MNMLKYLATSALAFTAAAASAETLTFEADFTGESYTEAGLTITATPASAAPVFINGDWDLPCCDFGGQFVQYELTTGDLFDLVSLDIVHSDPGDPIVFEGFLNGALVATNTIDGATGLYTFTGMDGVDLVRMTMTEIGFFNDPNFDDLVYNDAAVPEPASWAMMIAGFGLVGGALRRRATVAIA